MTDTNRLAELIKKAKSKMWGKTFHSELERNMFVADYLLANGVIVPICNCAECKYLKIVNKAPIYAECTNPKVIRKFLCFEEDTRKASCEYAEEKLKELGK